MKVLSADIGGTHARLGLFSSAQDELELLRAEVFPSAEFPGVEAIASRFLGTGASVDVVGLAVPGPVIQGRAQATNLPWTLEAASLQAFFNARFAAIAVHLLNDVEAMGHGIPVLPAGSLSELNKGRPRAGNAVLIAAGTGLGEALLEWDGKMHTVTATEGGHADFAPADGLQAELLDYLRAQFGHVSWERVVSGPGVLNLYRFLRDCKVFRESKTMAAQMQQGDASAAITQAGAAGSDELCAATLGLFVSCYGAEAGNLALKALATAGVYLGGGIAPQIIGKLGDGTFLRAFTAKGRMSGLLADIPVRVILDPHAALYGAAAYAVRSIVGKSPSRLVQPAGGVVPGGH